MSTLETAFVDIADAIRSKTGKSDLITPLDMPAEISGIEIADDARKITSITYTSSSQVNNDIPFQITSGARIIFVCIFKPNENLDSIFYIRFLNNGKYSIIGYSIDGGKMAVCQNDVTLGTAVAIVTIGSGGAADVQPITVYSDKISMSNFINRHVYENGITLKMYELPL